VENRHEGSNQAHEAGTWRWLTGNFEEVVCAVLLAVLVAAISTGVTFRYVFNSPLPWPEELARYALVWLTFIGAALATKRQGHIVVDFLGMLLPGRLRQWVALAVHAIAVVILAVFVCQGVFMVQKMWMAVSPALSIRLGLVYVSIPLGCALMIVHMIGQMHATLKAAGADGGR